MFRKNCKIENDMKLDQLLSLSHDKEKEPIATGFQHLDHITGGLRIGQLCTIAARPGMGKTEFAISLLRNIGVIQKVPTTFISLEQNELEIMRRLKASITGSWEIMPNKEITPPMDVIKEMEKIGFHMSRKQNTEQVAMQMMKDAPVWIEYDLGVSMNELISRMERLHQENQVRVVIIDSLHWIKFANKYNNQSQALVKLYQAANRLKMAVILTSRLDRSVETRSGVKRPQLSDLRAWSQIETYSSIVMFIYRPEYYRFETFEDNTPSKNMADIMVEKNSFGGVGYVRMHFDNHASFREIAYEDDDEKNHL